MEVEVMKYYKKFVGAKCYLSPISPDDADIFTEWLNDLELTKYLKIIRRTYTLLKEKEILEKMAKQDHAYVIVDNEINKPIGIVSIHNIDHINNICELGLFIGDKDYWNLGYGEEATRLMLDFAFTVLNINNVMLLVFDFNVRAIKCYQKIGFKEIGRRREAYQIAGKKYDIVYMDILNEEFDSTYLKQMFSEEYETSLKPKKIEMV